MAHMLDIIQHVKFEGALMRLLITYIQSILDGIT